MNATRQKLIRDLIAAKRALEVAQKAYTEANNAYRLAESLYLKEVPVEGTPPGDVYCDPYFISVNDEWRRNDGMARVDFIEAERCPTSE